MNAINKVSLATVIGLLSAISNGSFAATPTDVSGTYNCEYNDPFSNPPNATETIVFKQTGDIIKVSHIAKDAVVPYFLGKGIFNKDVPNAFAYLYWQPKSPSTTSVELFTIKPDGSLDGIFANSNRDKVGKETCIKSTTQE